MAKILKNIYGKVESYFLEKADVQKLNVHAVKKSHAKSESLVLETDTLQKQTLEEWKLALMLATDIENPNRSVLQRLYENLLLDNHLGSVIDSRVLYSQRAPFKIVDNQGNEVEELSELLERTWFEDFVEHTLNSRFQGTQLIELFEINSLTKELKEIEVIPIAHFNPQKGIITKNPGDQTGWFYKDGGLVNHYIQVGKNKDLGMLAKLAPTVLGKKLGWGSWLDYLEKYGVGSLFITTEHQGKADLNRLERAARAFRSAGYMITNGGEKIEVKGADAGNPQNFDLLIERANSEISKRVLGGAGITDDKAYVGSSEIQFQLAQDRYDSDLLLLKNVINQELLPRLVKLSPVYAPFATHDFDWQEKEEDKKELSETVAKLAPHFVMDPEELSQRMGITLLSQKSGSILETEKEVEEETTEKKKIKPKLDAYFQSIVAEYKSLNHRCGDGVVNIQALDFSHWDSIIDRIAKDLHEGKIKPGDLDEESIKATYNELYDAGKKGYGKDWISFPADGKGDLPNELKKNLYMFSGAKIYSQLEKLNQLLYDKDGKLRPYSEFEVYARKINRDYNRNYLQAEWQTARTAAQMAQKWERMQEDKDLFPNLEFRTVGDDRVREDHAQLDGIIKPIDDAFWAKYYPPLDWRCRCNVMPTAAEPRGEVPDDMPDPNFQGNVALDGEIFTEKGSFFKLINTNENALRNQELFKLNAPYEIAYNGKNGKKVYVNIFADRRDLQNNIDISKTIVDNHNTNIWIRPHINLDKFKNPELWDGKIIGDITVRQTSNVSRYVSNSFDSKYGKNGQLKGLNNSFIALSLNNLKLTNSSFDLLSKQLWAKFKHYRTCSYIIIENTGNTVRLERKLLKGNYADFRKEVYSIKTKEPNK